MAQGYASNDCGGRTPGKVDFVSTEAFERDAIGRKVATREYSRQAALSVTLLATGEIKITRPPSCNKGGGGRSVLLDHKRKLQEPKMDISTGEILDMRNASKEVRAGYGGETRQTRFGARAKSTIRESGAVLDGAFGANIAFLTWTIPGHGEEIFDAACRYSAQFTQDVMQWCRDTASGIAYVWVYEFQKRGALHQHIVVGSNDSQGIARIIEEFPKRMRWFWLKWSRQAGVNYFRNCKTGRLNVRAAIYGQKAMRAYKSCARYLTKYLSKLRTKTGDLQHRYPARWWRASMGALRLCKSQRSRIRFVGSAYVMEQLRGVIIAEAERLGAQLVSYPNAKYPWLMNHRLWSPSVGIGQFQWAILKRTVLAAVGADCRVLQLLSAPDMVAAAAPVMVAELSFEQFVHHSNPTLTRVLVWTNVDTSTF